MLSLQAPPSDYIGAAFWLSISNNINNSNETKKFAAIADNDTMW